MSQGYAKVVLRLTLGMRNEMPTPGEVALDYH